MNTFNNNAAGKRKMKFRVWLGLAALLILVQPVLAVGAALQQADFVSLPGDEVEIRLTFDQTPPDPATYHIDKPARLVFDFAGTRNALASKYFNLGTGNARNMTVVDSKDRTRLILGMGEVTGYSTKVKGNQLFITVGKTQVSPASAAAPAAMPAAGTAAASPQSKSIDNIDFRRGDLGDGQIMIDLSQPSISVDVQQQGNKIIARFAGAKVPDRLRRRLDVTDFATPVKAIDTYSDNGNGVMVIEPTGEFEYLAYQADKRMTISVKPVSKDSKRKKDFAYSGEKLSLNFQDIEVRTVLQLIADFTSMNLVASDTVSGKITLRLQNVPWDQALDLILKTKGLDKRTVGNVMLVAPADEIAKREQLELENNNQSEQLAPLHTEFIQVNYAKAGDLQGLVSGGNVNGKASSRLLSARGSASLDVRTNTLIVVDTSKKIEEIRDVIAKLDVPVRQVMIESRIVLATTSFDKELGVNWNIARDQFTSRPSRNLVSGTETGLSDIRESVLDPTTGGRTYKFAQGDTMAVDLGVQKAGVSSLAVGLMNIDNIVLDLQLSALQSEGHGEVVATPKVMTADKQKARISAGTQIPYEQATSSGATAIAFQSAELSLEVTPSITPDGRISMDLAINNDSLGQVLSNGAVTINTNRVLTTVVVDDGQTVVLGGIFKDSRVKTVTKTPFLGDIPYLGRLFRKDVTTDEKDELLVFVTPRLVNDAVASK
jgi:type IV pilus assembly protein PilQ